MALKLLQKTIESMLTINRDDFEIILSVNQSDDDAFNYVSKISFNCMVISSWLFNYIKPEYK